MGFPVLRLLSSFMHAVATTPVELLVALFARFTINDSLPRINAGSASTLPFSRPAQRSLTLRPACSPSSFSEPSTPWASAASLPPRLLWLLPVGAKVTGQVSHLLENSAFARRTSIFGYHYQSFQRQDLPSRFNALNCLNHLIFFSVFNFGR